MKETDKAKDYLCQIPKTDKLIKRLCNTVATLRSSLTSVSCELKPDKVQTSGSKDTMAATIAKIVDLEREIDQRIDELVDLKREAFRLISQLPDHDQQNVLIARYVQGMKWEAIAYELEHEVRWVYRVHGKGLVAFLSVMDSMK